LCTIDPFIWVKQKMADLGNLGGLGGCAASINERGQVVGYSDMEGDMHQHAFLWENGTIIGLSTLGGGDGGANVFDEDGEIAGLAFLTGGQALHATAWKNGVIKDLKTAEGDPCSVALGMNSRGQVVGSSGDCDLVSNQRAFLWENGAIVDLNSLVPAGSGLPLEVASQINKRGKIEGFGVLESGDPRAFVLIPQDRDGDAEAKIDATGRLVPPALDAASRAAAKPAKGVDVPDAALGWRRSRMALFDLGAGYRSRLVQAGVLRRFLPGLQSR
jgi:probable HAF family extracellular repeat protein